MQFNQTQPSPLTVLFQLNFCCQVVSPDAHPSSYSSVATTLYPTLVCMNGSLEGLSMEITDKHLIVM